MENTMETYVAKALEGYEQNYAGISEAIEKMEGQLAQMREHKEEMSIGIKEMKELLGLEAEDEEPKLRMLNPEE
tara:strand:- start:61 stop:282 length:222 start_codon:yes stop_codon:yes gene_type:complete